MTLQSCGSVTKTSSTGPVSDRVFRTLHLDTEKAKAFVIRGCSNHGPHEQPLSFLFNHAKIHKYLSCISSWARRCFAPGIRRLRVQLRLSLEFGRLRHQTRCSCFFKRWEIFTQSEISNNLISLSIPVFDFKKRLSHYDAQEWGFGSVWRYALNHFDEWLSHVLFKRNHPLYSSGFLSNPWALLKIPLIPLFFVAAFDPSFRIDTRIHRTLGKCLERRSHQSMAFLRLSLKMRLDDPSRFFSSSYFSFPHSFIHPTFLGCGKIAVIYICHSILCHDDPS